MPLLRTLLPKPTVEKVAAKNARRRKDLVFVHINKTAGSSVSHQLGIERVHLPVQKWVEIVGPDEWERRFTFAFVRDPWAKVASHYRYRTKTNQTNMGEEPIGFNDWVKRAYGEKDPRYYDIPLMFAPQVAWLDLDGQLAVDFVGHFENLDEDFAIIAEAVGADPHLPALRQTDPKKKVKARDLYDAEAYEVVAQHFAPDLEAFGYEA